MAIATGTNDLLAIEVASECDFAGIAAPFQVLCAQQTLGQIKPWSDLGLGWYCGRAAYHASFSLPEKQSSAILDLGEVEHYAEVWVNNTLAGIRLWPPYQLDITNLLCQGKNTLSILVSNSIANRFTWDKWSDARTGSSWGVPPRAERSGLLSQPKLIWH